MACRNNNFSLKKNLKDIKVIYKLIVFFEIYYYYNNKLMKKKTLLKYLFNLIKYIKVLLIKKWAHIPPTCKKKYKSYRKKYNIWE